MQARELMGSHIPNADQWMEVSFDVFDIVRRIREGDESGWRGDPNASIMFNPMTKMFEVWLVDERNTPYIACSSDRCDHSLIVKLIEGDWQRGKRLLEEIQKKNRAAHEARLTEDKDRAEEIADKLHWAIIRDIGHLEGGNRRQYSFATKGK
jgi:hypothetical protein